MEKLKKYKTTILWVLGLVIVVLLVLMAVHSVKAFHVVLRENLQEIELAGDILNDAEAETMDRGQYENLITQYANMTLNSIQSINGISENLWIFKQYDLQHFEWFVLDGAALAEQDMEQMEVIMQIQGNIEKARTALGKSDNALSLFWRGKESAAHYFAEIENICKTWEKKY